MKVIWHDSPESALCALYGGQAEYVKRLQRLCVDCAAAAERQR